MNQLRHLIRPRRGPRPQTSDGFHHIQLDQFPPPAVIEELHERAFALPGVKYRQSRITMPETKALSISTQFAKGPQEAFVDDHEFCYLHALPAASVHATLSTPDRELLISCNWGESHPGTRVGVLPDTLVLIYAPRDAEELELVIAAICASLQFARG